ncbi:hypothetical protein B9T33_05855 [Acinetobacter sp. ANC 5054]|uniref:hypothetical protein n=1 Tax=Acinetobacter sp. ANC 5054 TaxID=1977877 RepID=UPI000A33E585|nr:hypothetical protein [Acinetobacter sp. ANC 5054]OTG82042.1 hypothetical protein B9T33_05855 [Acinetobacter sp. ANC 5054]
MVGNIGSGDIDYGKLAQGATSALLPLLASINKGDSSIDMDQLTHVLPTVVGSVTNLVSAISKANQGNIPETISGVIKGLNPLLDILAKSDVIDADQAQTVKAVYDVLNSVNTILDFANNPSLLTLSSDLDNVIDSLKPVIALMDSSGEASQFLDNINIPNIGDLLANLAPEKIDLGSLSDKFGQIGDTITGSLPDISELLQNVGGSSGNFDISTLVPSISDALGQILYPISTLPIDHTTTSFNLLDLNTTQSYV